MSKWIKFKITPRLPGRKTDIWFIETKDGNTTLGLVKWYSHWRKYCFIPAEDTIFEQDCLRDIASFIEDQTKLHRNTNK